LSNSYADDHIKAPACVNCRRDPWNLVYGGQLAMAIRTAKQATIMTKWRIGFEMRGRRLAKPGVKPARR
jgi:hypothetical protein